MNKYSILALLMSFGIPLGVQAQTKVVTTYVNGQVVDQYVENEYTDVYYDDQYDEVYEEEVIYEEAFDEVERREVYIVETAPEVVHVYYERPAANISFQIIPFFRLRYYYPTANIHLTGWFPGVYHKRYNSHSYYRPIRHAHPRNVYHSRLPKHARHAPKGYKPHYAHGKHVKQAPRGHYKGKAYGSHKKGWKGNKNNAYKPRTKHANKYSPGHRSAKRGNYKSHNNSRRSQPKMSPGKRSRSNNKVRQNSSRSRSNKMYAQKSGRRGGRSGQSRHGKR